MNPNGITLIFNSRLNLPPEEGGLWFSNIDAIRKECIPWLYWDEQEKLVHPELAPGAGVLKGRWWGIFPFTMKSVRWEMVLHDDLDIKMHHPDFYALRKIHVRDQVAWVKDEVFLGPKSRLRMGLWFLLVTPLFWVRHYKLRRKFHGESYTPEWERNYF